MRLNPDCIRDILLTIEDRSDGEHRIGFPSDASTALAQYSNEEIMYSLRQCNENGLLSGVTEYISGSIWVRDLTPKGHEFLANIRSETTWEKIKRNAPAALIKLIEIAASIRSVVD